mmetsp:Transcript_21241/g.34320  ORF Transcript_21241/g.34320 Transcript_21241/m.34320 type:complete len:424 (+) Transcript_21241:496-1767(+)
MGNQVFQDEPPTKADVKALQSRNRTLLAFTVVTFVVAVIALGLGGFAAAGGMKHEDDISTLKNQNSEVILRVGQPTGVAGFPHSSSLYAGSGFWTTKKKLLEPTSDFQAVASGDMIYLIGGQNTTGGGLDTLTQYDTLLEAYTVLPPMPAPRMRFGAAILDNKIYVINGLTKDGTAQLTTTLIYDITTKVWSNGPQTAVGRSDTCAATAGGKIYIVAGYDATYKELKSVEVMDPAATAPVWSAAADLPEPRGDVTCASSGSSVYAIGGFYDPKGEFAANSFHATMFQLDTTSSTTVSAWKTMANMRAARGDKAAATLADGSIVVIGGEGHARKLVTQIPQHPVEQFFPEHNTWITKASIPTARFRFAAAAVNGFVHAFGGHVLCKTGWNGDYSDTSCATNALDSHEVLMDVAHPDVWVHTSKK